MGKRLEFCVLERNGFGLVLYFRCIEGKLGAGVFVKCRSQGHGSKVRGRDIGVNARSECRDICENKELWT